MIVNFKKRSDQWGRSKLLRKIQKIRSFLTKSGCNKLFGKTLSRYAADLNGVPNISAKSLGFRRLLQ